MSNAEKNARNSFRSFSFPIFDFDYVFMRFSSDLQRSVFGTGIKYFPHIFPFHRNPRKKKSLKRKQNPSIMQPVLRARNFHIIFLFLSSSFLHWKKSPPENSTRFTPFIIRTEHKDDRENPVGFGSFGKASFPYFSIYHIYAAES